MNTAFKIAVVGDKDSVIAFKALGLVTVECDTAQRAKSALRDLTTGEEQFAVIYITEALAAEMPDEVAAYREIPVPALILIPSKTGSLGLGLEALTSAAERATGTKLF
jgi:V/A-type H+-transporting ATPase subunit F